MADADCAFLPSEVVEDPRALGQRCDDCSPVQLNGLDGGLFAVDEEVADEDNEGGHEPEIVEPGGLLEGGLEEGDDLLCFPVVVEVAQLTLSEQFYLS